MNKPRYMNMYKALKKEFDFYKNQNLNFYVESRPFQHLQLKAAFTQSEVMDMPKDCISEILIIKMARAFEDIINNFPIKANFNQDLGIYETTIDLWINTEV